MESEGRDEPRRPDEQNESHRPDEQNESRRLGERGESRRPGERDERGGRDDSRDARVRPDAHPHERAASELADRAAESVERRYDATKEIFHETRDAEDDAGD